MDLSRFIRSDDYESRYNRSDEYEGYVSEDYESEGHDDDWLYDMLRVLNITCIVVFSLACVFGALVNGLVVWATGFKLKKTTKTVWFLNLAAADLLYIAFLPMSVMWKALALHWPLGKFMCKLYSTSIILAMFASGYVLVAMSVDRCVSVVWPVWAQRHRSVRTASCVSVGVWVLSLVLSCPELIFADTEPCPHDDDPMDYARCVSNYGPPENFREQAMVVFYFLLGYGVPLAAILSCYAVIIYRLRRNGGSPADHSSSKGRPFRITAAVTASFFLCFLCYHVTQIQYAVFLNKDQLKLHWLWVNVGTCLEALYHCLNPLLYVLMAQDFKKKHSILKVLERAFAEEEPSPSNPSTDIALSDAEKVFV